MKFNKQLLIGAIGVISCILMIIADKLVFLAATAFVVFSIVLIIGIIKAATKNKNGFKRIISAFVSVICSVFVLFLSLGLSIPDHYANEAQSISETQTEPSKDESTENSSGNNSKLEFVNTSSDSGSTVTSSNTKSSKETSSIVSSKTNSSSKVESKANSSVVSSKNTSSKLTSSKTITSKSESQIQSKVTSSKINSSDSESVAPSSITESESTPNAESETMLSSSHSEIKTYSFICNQESMCYHTHECSAAKKMLADKRLDYTVNATSYDEAKQYLENQGYWLCGICKR